MNPKLGEKGRDIIIIPNTRKRDQGYALDTIEP